MKNGKFIVSSITIGFILGALTVFLLIRVGVNPQFKDAYILNEALVIELNSETILIPKGVTVQMVKSIDGQPYYSLHFVGWPDVKTPIVESESWEYFFIKR